MKRRIGALALFVLLSAAAIAAAAVLLLALGWYLLTGRAPARAEPALWALDRFGNAGLFGGNEFETISSHVGRLVREPGAPLWARFINAALRLADDNHCIDAAESEALLLAAISNVNKGTHG